MSQAKLTAVKELVQEKEYSVARAVLETMPNDPTAVKWLAQLKEKEIKEATKINSVPKWILDAERKVDDERNLWFESFGNTLKNILEETYQVWSSRIPTYERTAFYIDKIEAFPYGYVLVVSPDYRTTVHVHDLTIQVERDYGFEITLKSDLNGLQRVWFSYKCKTPENIRQIIGTEWARKNFPWANH